MKKIAIWTTLQFANYGDDLQAIAIANYVKGLGYMPVLYNLDTKLSKLYGLQSVRSIDELLSNSVICIIAGGAQLVSLNILKRVIPNSYSEWESMFKEFYEGINKYNTRVLPISIGGDGRVVSPFWYYGKWRTKLFESPLMLSGTTRLPGDIAQMECFGKHPQYYPDMLFRVGDYFKPSLLSPTSKTRVGLNFRNGRHLDMKLVESIEQYAKENDNIEFHFLTTHLEHKGLNYQYLPQDINGNIVVDRYETPDQLLGVLQSMDIVVSSMLHIGITSLAQGTPFLSYRGPEKTKAFLRSIEGEWAILDKNIDFETLKLFIKTPKIELLQRYNINTLNFLMRDSNNHYLEIRNVLKKLESKNII